MPSPAVTASEDIDQLLPPQLDLGIKQEQDQECDDPPRHSDQNQPWTPERDPNPNIDIKTDQGQERASSPPALTNGHSQHDDIDSQHPDAPPAKRRKIADVEIISAKPSPRSSSPPWKSVHAAGPTSFVENGKRRSGRTNAVPLEMQPHSNRRQTRAAFEKTAEKHTKPSYNDVKKPPPPPSHNKTASVDRTSKKIPAKSSRELPSHQTASKSPKSAKSADKDELQKQLTQLKAHLKHQARSSDDHSVFSSDLDSELSSLSSEPEFEPDPPISPRVNLTKVTFRLNLPKPTVGSPLHLPQPRQYSSLADFLDNNNIQDPTARPPATDEQIRRDAAERIHVRQARRPRSIASAPKSQDPPRQYAHLDHLLAHAVHFRGLLRRESAAHRRAAQALAHEAKRYLEEKAKRGRVKTVAELQQEQLLLNHSRYKTVVKDLTRLWLAVDAEVMATRRKLYEDEQQAKIKGHLSRVLDRTTQMLKRHDAELSDSELMTNDDDDEDDRDEDDNASDAAQSSADSEQMSADDSDSADDASSRAADSDAEMTLEELKAKYEDIPALEREDPRHVDSQDAESESNQAEDDSDTETVMDSELDTSDSDDDSEGGNSNGEEESGDDEQQSGLLSLLFSKRELASAKSAVPMEAPEDQLEDTQSDAHNEDADVKYDSIETGTLPEATKANTVSVDDKDSTHEKNAPMDLDQIPVSGGAMDIDTPESRDQSARVSPVTSTSKATELESASSVEQQIEAVSTPKPSVSTPIPPLLRGTLREYQHEGLDWLAKLYADGRSGILADEMGLGKTIQSIALLAHLATTYEVWGPHLIVVPTSVMLNWEMEFKKFLPGFKVLTYYGDIAERKAKRRGWMAEDSFNVCITSYQLVLKDAVSFKKRRWHYMILDEAHNIKNFRSERWQTMMTFNTRARLLLTGTPLQNNLTELWSLLFFLHYGQEDEGEDGPFAGLAEWSEWFKKPVQSILEHGNQVLDREDQEQVVKLHKVIRPFLLRRLKRDVEKQMPLKYEHVEMCRLSKRQRQLYDGFMSRAQTRETLASGNYLSIINALMQLRKVCNHPDLFETRPINTSFAMSRAVAADFEIRDLLVRRKLLNAGPLDEVDLNFLALGPLSNEKVSRIAFIEMVRLNARVPFAALREQQWARVRDRSKIFSAANRHEVRSSLESDARWTRLQLIDRTMYYEAYKHNQRPLYGPSLLQKLQIDTRQRLLSKSAHDTRLPRFWETSPVVYNANLSLSVERLSHRMEPLVAQFACVTPKTVAVDFAKTAVTEIGSEAARSYSASQPSDPFHQAQMKLSIAFPDKRLLQYDCGKLQRLDGLLRRLQAGGHRALIFTQMTKVLDILEQFLNIHGHRYLRLDGATKIEQRQILTDRFNNDNRILCFILSSRSGGLGINLTGADTVIFYDLDWNPAMDKQCTDRAHRIGQTRDVHIYRFVSEHTIEANILRKANQKQLLDDVVIQEGDFTTDYLNRTSYKDMLVESPPNDDVAGAAMDRVLGGGVDSKGTTFEQAEDKEDIAAARVAANEVQHADDGDFDESLAANKASISGKGLTSDPFSATDAAIAEANLDSAGNGFKHIDDYLMRMQQFLYKDLPLSYGLKDKSKKNRRKKGAEPRMRR